MSDDDVPTGRAPAPNPNEIDEGESAADLPTLLPKRLRRRFIDAVGVRATHAAEDGATLGILFALTFVSPEVLGLLTLALFGDALKPRRLLRRADEVVRTDDIQAQPLYFIVAFGVGAGVVSAIGVYIKGVGVLPLL